MLNGTIGCYVANVRPIGNVGYDRRSFFLVVGHRTIGRGVVARSTSIGEDRTTSGSHKRSVVRSIVAPDDRSHDQ